MYIYVYNFKSINNVLDPKMVLKPNLFNKMFRFFYSESLIYNFHNYNFQYNNHF